MKYYLTNIDFKRKQYETTKSAKFKGVLSIISNEHGIVMDWKITFSNVEIDLYTTPAWFTGEPNIFKYREELFRTLGLKQEKRPSKDSNKLVTLSENQLSDLNNFLNDRSSYKSTIKMIVGILKGNNPGGEAKNPNSAELIIDSCDTPLKNFVILLDDLVIKHNSNFEAMAVWAKEIALAQFSQLNDTLKKAFEFMQKPKNKVDFQIYLSNIKDYYKNYNDFAQKGEQIASEARKIYTANIVNKYSNSQLPFDLKFSGQYQRCHIYEYHSLKNMIIESLYEGDQESAKKYSNMISDPENFIPLPEEIHRHFDKDWFTYKKDGNIYAIHEKGFDYIQNYVLDKYKKIPEWFMTPKRVKYFDLRNQNIIF